MNASLEFLMGKREEIYFWVVEAFSCVKLVTFHEQSVSQTARCPKS